MTTNTRALALSILDAHEIPARGDRIDKLATLIEELGHADVRLELVPRGGLMRSQKATTRKIGQMRTGKSAVEVWAFWKKNET